MGEPAAVAEVREAYAACTELAKKVKAEERTWICDDRYCERNAHWLPGGPRDAGFPYALATLHDDADGRLFATLLESSPSGDWELMTEYCYRSDGSLAFLFSTLRTYYGGVKAETRRYYEPTGKEVWSKRAFFDLETGKPTKKGFQDNAATVYLTKTKLRSHLGLR